MTNQSETTNKRYRQQIVSNVPTVRFNSTVTRFNRKIPAIVFCVGKLTRDFLIIILSNTLAKTSTFNMNTVVLLVDTDPHLSPSYEFVEELISQSKRQLVTADGLSWARCSQANALLGRLVTICPTNQPPLLPTHPYHHHLVPTRRGQPNHHHHSLPTTWLEHHHNFQLWP